MIKRLAWYFSLYWKFMCTDKNNYKNKMNLPRPSFHSYFNCWKTTKSNDKNKMNLPPSSFHSFLSCWKTTKSSKTLKFSKFQFVFINVLWKIKRNCLSGLFCIVNLFEVSRKKHFSNFMDFNPVQTKMK